MRQVSDVAWDSISDHQLPWHSKLFVIYLIVVATLTLVRLGVFVRDLRFLGTVMGRKTDPLPETDLMQILDAFWTKLQGMKRSVIMTFLLAVLVAADQVRTDFGNDAV
jgi:hypothetical protein